MLIHRLRMIKRISILIALLLVSCAETRLYDHGKLVAVIQGDAKNITIKTNTGVYFHASALTHSTATTAAGKAHTRIISASGGIIATVVTGGGPGALAVIAASAGDWIINLFKKQE